MYGQASRCVWAPSDTSWTGARALRGKKEASNTFVLAALTTTACNNNCVHIQCWWAGA